MRTPLRVEQHKKEIELKRAKALRDSAGQSQVVADVPAVENVEVQPVVPAAVETVEVLADDTAELPAIESMLADEPAQESVDAISEEVVQDAPAPAQQKTSKRK